MPSDVTALAIAIAVETVDTNVSDDVVFLRVTEQGLEVICGQAVEPSIVEALTQTADYLLRNNK